MCLTRFWYSGLYDRSRAAPYWGFDTVLGPMQGRYRKMIRVSVRSTKNTEICTTDSVLRRRAQGGLASYRTVSCTYQSRIKLYRLITLRYGQIHGGDVLDVVSPEKEKVIFSTILCHFLYSVSLMYHAVSYPYQIVSAQQYSAHCGEGAPATAHNAKQGARLRAAECTHVDKLRVDISKDAVLRRALFDGRLWC